MQPNRVKVTVYRTSGRGNPVSTLIAPIFGMHTADIGATATAEASPANAMTCVKPFTIPDKWKEVRRRTCDSTDHFERVYDKQVATRCLSRTRCVHPADQWADAGYTGYNMTNDRARRL